MADSGALRIPTRIILSNYVYDGLPILTKDGDAIADTTLGFELTRDKRALKSNPTGPAIHAGFWLQPRINGEAVGERVWILNDHTQDVYFGGLAKINVRVHDIGFADEVRVQFAASKEGADIDVPHRVVRFGDDTGVARLPHNQQLADAA